MTAKLSQPGKAVAGKSGQGEKPSSGDREARLSKALRENLRKRKAQARARTDARRSGGKDKSEG